MKRMTMSAHFDHMRGEGSLQRTKQPNRVAFFVRWRRHPHIESGSVRPSGAAESGSHSPPQSASSLLVSGKACESSPTAGFRGIGGSKPPPYREYARKMIGRAYFLVLNKIDELEGTNEFIYKHYRENVDK